MFKIASFVFLVVTFVFSLNIYAKNSQLDEWVFESKSVLPNAPRVKFVINEMYFIAYLITRESKPGAPSESTIRKFREKAKARDKVLFGGMAGYKNYLEAYIFEDTIVKVYSPYFAELRKFPEYKHLLSETKKYVKQGLAEWDANLKASSEFMKKYSGLDFNYELKVFITHPAEGNGHPFKHKEKTICFGAWPTFKNYFTVYIWHETLHLHLPPEEISHSAIQLLTDNDLRAELNHEKVNSYEGHPHLFQLMKEIEPDWIQYKKSPTDLLKFVSSVSKRESVLRLEKMANIKR